MRQGAGGGERGVGSQCHSKSSMIATQREKIHLSECKMSSSTLEQVGHMITGPLPVQDMKLRHEASCWTCGLHHHRPLLAWTHARFHLSSLKLLLEFMNKVSRIKLTISKYLLNSLLGHNKRRLNVQISSVSDGNAARLPIGPDTWPVPPAGSVSTANQWLVHQFLTLLLRRKLQL